MPRAPNLKAEEAKQLFLKGYKLVDIAKELGLPDGTIRRWKSTYDWDSERSDKKKENARKKGGQQGNKNAVGNKGGAPKGSKNHYIHGAYESIYWDTLDDEEKELIRAMRIDEEKQLEEQIQLLTIRERRLMKRIAEYTNISSKVALDSVVKRKLETTTKKEGKTPKNQYSEEETTTSTRATIDIIQQIEAELTRVQSRKTKCIDSLARLHLEQKKIGNGGKNEIVDDWISGVMDGDTSGEE